MFKCVYIIMIYVYIRAYESSKLYREIKLRGSILNKGALKHLPQEQLYNKVTGVWNLSSDQVKPFSIFFITL